MMYNRIIKERRKTHMERISRADLFMGIAGLVAKRSTCERAQVGAVIVRDGRVVSTGYVGSPPGMPHCLEVGCEMVDGHCIRTIHAEANAIYYAARKGITIEGGTMYCTHMPCRKCAQAILAAGIEVVCYEHKYSETEGVDLLLNSGVRVRVYNGRGQEING